MGPAILPTKPTGFRRTCVLDYPWFLLLFAIMPLTPSFSFFFLYVNSLFISVHCVCADFQLFYLFEIFRSFPR